MIERISLTTADPERLARFFERALGFAQIGIAERGGTNFAQLMGLPGARARADALRLGGQEMELLAFAERGASYPAESASNDRVFQHFAIVVSDMQRAYARLRESTGWRPITRGEPQLLPASSGGVTAFKFRDPEGHPLELLHFPRGHAPPPWQQEAATGPALGIDHSAIAVADTATSVAFYERLLGLSVAARSLNRGGEQERLDGLTGAVVDVTALADAAGSAPHLELLCYRAPPGGKDSALRSNDIAATRLVVRLSDKQTLAQCITDAGHSLISPGIVETDDGTSAALLRDPDGHFLLLTAGP